jgi:hypothetical protein
LAPVSTKHKRSVQFKKKGVLGSKSVREDEQRSYNNF